LGIIGTALMALAALLVLGWFAALVFALR